MIRLARVITGREVVVVFDGKYHGELDTTLVVLEDGEVVPEIAGLPLSVSGQTRVVPFNDAEALERALEPGDVALVLTEPALTNAGFLLPRDGFHTAVRRLTREAGRCWRSTRPTHWSRAYAGLARHGGSSRTSSRSASRSPQA